MKLASSEARNSAALATSHAVPIRPRSGTLASRSAATSARLRLLARARVSTAIGVSMSPGKMQLARMPYGAFCRASCSVKAIIAALVAVGDEGVSVLARSHGRDVDDGTGALQAHNRQYVLACHDRAAQVDRADAVEGLLAQFVQRLVAPPNAAPDIVVQDINAAPTRPSGLHRGGERLFLGHVGGEGHALATLRRHRSALLGGGDKPVDRQDPGALLREAERGRAAIADPLTGALPGPNDHSDLAFETHGKHSLQQVFKDASMVPPFASQPGRPVLADLGHSLIPLDLIGRPRPLIFV